MRRLDRGVWDLVGIWFDGSAWHGGEGGITRGMMPVDCRSSLVIGIHIMAGKKAMYSGPKDGHRDFHLSSTLNV